MKLRKVLLPVLLAVVLIASVLAGCNPASTSTSTQSTQTTSTTSIAPTTSETPKTIKELMAEDAKNPVTMTITMPYDYPPADDSPILAEFAKRTGITFKINCIPGDAHEKLGMMLASKSLSDIMVVYSDQMLGLYKQSDQILDLKPLLQKNAPTVLSMLSSDVNYNLADFFTDKDGRMLYISQNLDLLRTADEPYEMPNKKDVDYIWLPWGSSLYALYPTIDEVLGKKISTLDDWYQAMVAYHAKYPQNYATTMNSEDGVNLLKGFAQLYGYKVEGIANTLFITKDGKTYTSLARLPEAVDCLKFLNKLYKEGLMDQEGPIQSVDAMKEKMSAGKVFSFLGWYRRIYSTNDALGANDATKMDRFIPQPVASAAGVQRTEANTAYLGDRGMMITKTCSDPDRFARFLEYLYSDEGLILNGWGIEGEDYVVGADGKLTRTPEMQAKFVADDKLANNRGINLLFWMVDLPYHLSDGQTSNVYSSPVYVSAESMTDTEKAIAASKYNFYRDFAAGYWYDLSISNILLPDNSKESLTTAKIATPLNDLVCKAMVADTDAQIEQLYKDAIAQFELDGLSDLEKFVQDSIIANRK